MQSVVLTGRFVCYALTCRACESGVNDHHVQPEKAKSRIDALTGNPGLFG